jgi:flagellar biosynthetic protein FliR
MSAPQPFSIDWIWPIMWAMLRVSGFFIVAPFWSHRAVPKTVKVPIVLVLAFAVGPIIAGFGPVKPDSLWTLGGWAIAELATGAIIGFAFAALFYAIRMAGDIVGLQMGFAIVNVIDPNATGQVSLIGEFKYVLALLILMIVDGHHLMIAALVDTYRLIPIGGVSFGDLAFERLLRLTATAFVTAVKIGAPIMITLLLTDVALGIVARTVPQMNIFIVGFPLKIGIGFLILAASLPLLSQLFTRALSEIQTSTQQIISALAHA